VLFARALSFSGAWSGLVCVDGWYGLYCPSSNAMCCLSETVR